MKKRILAHIILWYSVLCFFGCSSNVSLENADIHAGLKNYNITHCSIEQIGDYKNIPIAAVSPDKVTDQEIEEELESLKEEEGTIDDDYVKEHYQDEGLTSVKEWKEYIRKSNEDINKSMVQEENLDKRYDWLIDHSEFQIDTDEIAEYSLSIVQSAEANVGLFGCNSLKEYYTDYLHIDKDTFYNNCYEEGLRTIERFLVIGAIANQEEIEILQSELEDYCKENKEEIEDLSKSAKQNVTFDLLLEKVDEYLSDD